MTGEQQSTIPATSSKEEQQKQHPNTLGDVAVVQPSFDDHDNRSAGPEKKLPDMRDGNTSPTRETHKRNLSEHFHDATTLTQLKSSESGQKHRRDFSGDATNPARAHRRIDSIGGSTSVERARPHRRIDSSGLDALTAAADFSREELEAAAAGKNRHSWNRHTNLRQSPVETTATFENASHRPGPVPHPSPPHINTNAAHHRHYPSLGSTAPPRPIYYNHPPYPQPPYPPTYHYPHHPGNPGYSRHHGQPMHPPPPGGYPVYARPPGQDPYMKHHAPMQQPTLEHSYSDTSARRPSPTDPNVDHKSSSTTNNAGMGPPVQPYWQRGGNTQGVQTYITGIGAGETTRTLHPNPASTQPPVEGSNPKVGHHRKLSSLSNLGPLFFGAPDSTGSGGRHHRSTSSSLSFLNALGDINESADATFLRNLQESTGTPAAAFDHAKLGQKAEPVVKQPPTVSSSEPSRLMPGGTSKRVRRKCTVVGCSNRVVQGGLCIAHGAKRKLCKHPGCKKHVKKAGLCSTHGPARKRCEVENCTKVAVQGGRCIAHGAKKKLCCVDQCTKQAILGGMCKKHHDQKVAGEEPVSCTIIPRKNRSSKPTKKPGHTRGLSIFQEISVDAVGDLLAPDGAKERNISQGASDPSSSRKTHRSTVSRKF